MYKLKNLKHIFAIWGIVMVLILSIVRLFGSSLLTPVTQFFTYRDAPFQNFLYKERWKPSTDQIAIIKIDDNTLNDLQARSDRSMLTIGKKTYIELVKKLESVGVKGIAFDIIFQNTDPDEDLFASALEHYRNTVIGVGSRCIPSDFPVAKLPKSSKTYVSCDGRYEGSELQQMLDASGGYIFPECIQDQSGSTYTCDSFPRSVYTGANWGLLSIDKNIDKRVAAITLTQAPFLPEGSTRYIPSLALSLYTSTNSGTQLYSGRIVQPFFGRESTYPYIPLSTVLTMEKRDLIMTFSNKYVFVGDTSKANHDMVISPVSGVEMPGVETHAHMLDGILQNRIPVVTPPATLYAMLCLVTLLIVAVYFLIPNVASPILAIVFFLFTIWFGRYLYNIHGIIFEVLPIMLGTSLLSFPITFIYRFFIVDRERRKLQKNFSHYIDPVVVQKITEMGGNIQLGGESKSMSVFFSDIANFTTISERLGPTVLFAMMTEYLSHMTDILIKQGGTLDKYIGDAVMGFFGAPLDMPDHAIRACRTALLMRQALPVFNQSIAKKGIEPIDFRVGIASGDVIVGNIGSEERFNYTVLGDTVNVASRLEGIGKEYLTHITISENTRKLLDSSFFVRELDTIAAKGKTEGIRIYELLPMDEHERNTYAYEQYARALILYRAGNYRDAGIIWEKQKDIDPPSRAMMERCLLILKGEIHVENGIYHMTHK